MTTLAAVCTCPQRHTPALCVHASHVLWAPSKGMEALRGVLGLFSSHAWAYNKCGSPPLIASCRLTSDCIGLAWAPGKWRGGLVPPPSTALKGTARIVNVDGKSCVRGGLCKNSLTQLVTMSITRHKNTHGINLVKEVCSQIHLPGGRDPQFSLHP